MASHAGVYRALVRLYPKDFRRHYGDDLVQHFVDLLGRDGASRTWPRITLDLVITVPRYRLETVMSQRQSTAALYATLVALTVAGLISILVGIYPGAILLAVAVVLAVVERGRLATATRPPNTELRRHLFITSAILAVVCVVATTAFLIELGDDEHWAAGKLLVYNTVFFTTAISAIACLIAGLRTRRSLVKSA
jgi:hypothetical protein